MDYALSPDGPAAAAGPPTNSAGARYVGTGSPKPNGLPLGFGTTPARSPVRPQEPPAPRPATAGPPADGTGRAGVAAGVAATGGQRGLVATGRSPVRPPTAETPGGATAPGDRSRSRRRAGAPPVPVKILIAGGFGVGKTTAVGAISEIAPLTTEAEMTSAGIGIDDPGGRIEKTTTTVAMDFGCVTIDQSLKLYLFGTPGQQRFGFMWDDLARGALGALVVVDSGRLDDSYPVVDYFERAQLPFVVAVNAFHGRLAHNLDAIRWALAINDHVPLVQFDARDRLSVRDALLVVLDRALERAVREKSG